MLNATYSYLADHDAKKTKITYHNQRTETTNVGKVKTLFIWSRTSAESWLGKIIVTVSYWIPESYTYWWFGQDEDDILSYSLIVDGKDLHVAMYP